MSGEARDCSTVMPCSRTDWGSWGLAWSVRSWVRIWSMSGSVPISKFTVRPIRPLFELVDSW